MYPKNRSAYESTELHAQLQMIYHLEARRPFTKDEEALKCNKEAEIKILVRLRNHFRIAAYNGEKPCSVPTVDDMAWR